MITTRTNLTRIRNSIAEKIVRMVAFNCAERKWNQQWKATKCGNRAAFIRVWAVPEPKATGENVLQ